MGEGTAAPGRREAELEAKVEALERTLEGAREALDASERRREIDLALASADAVDLETARLLTEVAVASMEAPDVAAVVSDLRRRKPFLFRADADPRGGSPGASAAMSAGAPTGAPGLEDEAERAARSGDRASVLRYLRARRGAG